MMKNGEHDKLWREAAESIGKLNTTMNNANILACITGLREVGYIDDVGYRGLLLDVLERSGYTLKARD